MHAIKQDAHKTAVFFLKDSGNRHGDNSQLELVTLPQVPSYVTTYALLSIM